MSVTVTPPPFAVSSARDDLSQARGPVRSSAAGWASWPNRPANEGWQEELVEMSSPVHRKRHWYSPKSIAHSVAIRPRLYFSVPCSSQQPNSRRVHKAACPLENYVHDLHRFLGPNFCEWEKRGQRFAKRSAHSLPTAKITTHAMRNRKIETATSLCFLNSLNPSLIRVGRRKKIERTKRKIGIAAATKAMILSRDRDRWPDDA
jgi:hypothetical protein